MPHAAGRGCLLHDVRSGVRFCQDITILTGRGHYRAGDKAVLPDDVRSFMAEVSGPVVKEVLGAPGALKIAERDLRSWLGKVIFNLD